jgi:hypothetical protein
MSLTYYIDPAAGLITMTAHGDITFQDLRTTLAVMHDDPQFSPSFDRLWDLRDGHPTLRGPEVRALARVVGQFIGGRRSAIAAPSDVAYGLSRMYSTLLEDTIAVEVFRNMEDARAWLAGVGCPAFVPEGLRLLQAS